MRKRTWLIIATPVAVFMVLWGSFGYSSICINCGMEQHTTEWQIPFTQATYFRMHSTTDTPLSLVVNRDHLDLGSAHDWLFAAGGGNGVTCAIGPGRHLLSAVLSTKAATFVDMFYRFQGKSEAQKWLGYLLNPKRSMLAMQAVDLSNLPATGFANATQFEEWRSTNREMLKEIMDDLAAPAPN